MAERHQTESVLMRLQDPSTIIHKLPQLRWEDRVTLSKALILATPGLAHWFEMDNPFLKDAMSWMYTPIVGKLQPSSFVGIVDALPAPEYFHEWQSDVRGPHSPAEGIAICLMSDIICRERSDTDGDNPSILHIQSRTFNEVEGKKSVQEKGIFARLSIPFANTLFVNGSPYTAFRSVWQATSEHQSLVPKYGRRQLQMIQFSLPKTAENLFQFHVPMYALTEERRVISSMGNVVRQVEDSNGNLIGASTELEAAVPKFLAGQKAAGKDAQIQVFARVMPAERLELISKDLPPQQVPVPVPVPVPSARIPETPQTAIDEKTDQSSKFPTRIGLWTENGSYDKVPHTTLWHRGQFYRVTGGGGGWGKKAGLLSLDPSVNFESIKNSESSMFPDPDSLDNDSTGAAKIDALVPAGHTIQFFATEVQEPIQSYFTNDSSQSSDNASAALFTPEEWSNHNRQRWLFGTTASADAVQSEGSKVDARMAPKTMSLRGCFGALSYGGVSVQVTERTPKKDGLTDDPRSTRYERSVLNEFRIDAPFSLFRATHKLREPKPAVETESIHVRKIQSRPQPERRQTKKQHSEPGGISGVSKVNEPPVGVKFRRPLRVKIGAQSEDQQERDQRSEPDSIPEVSKVNNSVKTPVGIEFRRSLRAKVRAQSENQPGPDRRPE